MTTFTKEQLIEQASHNLRLMSSQYGDQQCNEAFMADFQLMKIALAAMTAEPMAYMHRSGQVVTREECCDDNTFAICCKVDTPLYSVPPAPVSVPDDFAGKSFEYIANKFQVSISNAQWILVGWNACRTAMQGKVESSESLSSIQTAPALDSVPEIAVSVSSEFQAVTGCSCRTCRPVTIPDMRFVVCPDCGNKRCPHANDHRNACTGSNEPGQEGSAYPAAPQQEVKP